MWSFIEVTIIFGGLIIGEVNEMFIRSPTRVVDLVEAWCHGKALRAYVFFSFVISYSMLDYYKYPLGI